jgi:hypothetical protein
MAYTRVNWKARQGIRLNKYAKTEETPNSVILVNTPEQITEEGTPISAENLNSMDEGIANLDEAVTELSTAVENKVDKHSTDRLMTAAEGTKLSGIEAGAQKNPAEASTSAAGLMSTADKTKLNGIAAGAQQNPGTATSGAAGLMSASDKSKLDGLSSNRYLPAGTVVFTAMTAAQQAANRLIILDGSCISVSLYPDLVNATNVNSTSTSYSAFYRCTTSSKSSASSSRSTSGAYFKLPDCRGMFLRGRGTADTDLGLKMSGGAYYTGGSYMGGIIQDAMQGHRHGPLTAYSYAMNSSSTSGPLGGASGSLSTTTGDPATDGSNSTPRTAAETRPASISLDICIAY